MGLWINKVFSVDNVYNFVEYRWETLSKVIGVVDKLNQNFFTRWIKIYWDIWLLNVEKMKEQI